MITPMFRKITSMWNGGRVGQGTGGGRKIRALPRFPTADRSQGRERGQRAELRLGAWRQSVFHP